MATFELGPTCAFLGAADTGAVAAPPRLVKRELAKSVQSKLTNFLRALHVDLRPFANLLDFADSESSRRRSGK